MHSTTWNTGSSRLKTHQQIKRKGPKNGKCNWWRFGKEWNILRHRKIRNKTKTLIGIVEWFLSIRQRYFKRNHVEIFLRSSFAIIFGHFAFVDQTFHLHFKWQKDFCFCLLPFLLLHNSEMLRVFEWLLGWIFDDKLWDWLQRIFDLK